MTRRPSTSHRTSALSRSTPLGIASARPLSRTSPTLARSGRWRLASTGALNSPCTSTLALTMYASRSVALHSVSIAHVLDTSYDENISLDEALVRNKRDAASRPVVWNAESLAERVTDEDDKLVVAEPVAVKDPSGKIIPFELVSSAESEEMAHLRQKIGIEFNEDALVVAKGHMEETLVDSNISDNEALRRAVRPGHFSALL